MAVAVVHRHRRDIDNEAHSISRHTEKSSKRGDAADVNTSPDPGAVDEAITSISLDQREHNPDHAAEDAEPLATRPPGPPSSPNNFGYKRGGPVKRRIGYQQGGEVDDEEDPTEGTDEEEQ